MKKIIGIIIGCILTNINLQAQSIVAKSFVKNKQVFLRFVAKNPDVWEEIKNKGFKIERAEISKISDTTELNRIGFSLLTVTPIKPLPKDDPAWNELIQTTNYSSFLYKGLYGVPIPKDEKSKKSALSIWGMLMKQADLNAESAKLLGLYYKDTEINTNKFYVYKISVFEKVGPTKYQITLLVDPKKETYLPEINLKLSEAKGKRISLTFNAKVNQPYYSGYVLERSEDSLKGYVSVTSSPIIFIVGEHEKNKTTITHQDTLPNANTIFYYRLKGISYFGESGPYGKTIRVKGKEMLGAFPFMDSVKLIKNETQLKVYFHFPKETNLTTLKGIKISRTEKSGNLGTILTSSLLPITTTSYIDEKPLQTNYYKVLAFTKDGDTIPSFEGFGMLPDRIPPQTPTDIKGYIDSTGLVHLNWKSNTEKDIQGYRIFRKNDLREELIERTRRIITTPEYIDTVDIKTLSKYVYYSLTAVDNVFNNSGYSSLLKLKRPDIIPPVAPVFVKTVHDQKRIHIKWYNSTSDDVEKYELYRINFQTKQSEKLKEWMIADTSTIYKDTTAVLGETYQYKLIVYDDSKNKSESLSPFITFETGLRKPIIDITQKVDLEKRTIELYWNYPEKDIYNFIVYKAKEGEALRIYKTLKPADMKLIDKNIYPGNIYLYRIKATYISGVESELSKEIKVTF